MKNWIWTRTTVHQILISNYEDEQNLYKMFQKIFHKFQKISDIKNISVASASPYSLDFNPCDFFYSQDRKLISKIGGGISRIYILEYSMVQRCLAYEGTMWNFISWNQSLYFLLSMNLFKNQLIVEGFLDLVYDDFPGKVACFFSVLRSVIVKWKWV